MGEITSSFFLSILNIFLRPWTLGLNVKEMELPSSNFYVKIGKVKLKTDFSRKNKYTSWRANKYQKFQSQVNETNITCIKGLKTGRGGNPTRRRALSAAAKAWFTRPFLNWDLDSTNWLMSIKLSHRGNTRFANSWSISVPKKKW